MNRNPVLAAGVGLLFMILSAAAFGAAGAGPKARLFAKYDANRNGVIDGDEVAALRKDFAADPHGELARYDANQDGKLSDDEISEIKPPGKSGERKGGKKTEPKKETAPAENPPPAAASQTEAAPTTDKK